MSKHHTPHESETGAPENAQAGAEMAGKTGDCAGNAAENAANGAENMPGPQGENPPNPAETDPGQAAAEPPEPSPEEQIAGLEALLAETKDQLLRKAADFENFRKRMNQEKQNAIDFANQSLLADIIPIIDDFERAIQSVESATDFTDLPAGRAFLDGVAMIEKRLTGQLESKWGLKRFDSAGEPFDPNRHEALMMEKSPDITEPVVQEDLQKGYTLKERVIRAAKVKVLMPEVGNGE